jgi:hypothetical protein
MSGMARIDLDPRTVERLIEGRLAADDLPPGARGAAQVLGAARLAATQRDLTALDATVAAMAAAAAAAAGGQQRTPEPAASPAASGSRASSPFPKLLAGSAAGLTVLFGGLAAAGALPSAAQNPVAEIVSHVGIDLPRGDQSAKAPSETASAAVTSTTSSTVADSEQQATAETTAVTPETTVVAPSCTPTVPGPGTSDVTTSPSSTTSTSALAGTTCTSVSVPGDQHGGPTTSTTAAPSTTTTLPASGTGGSEPAPSGSANGQHRGSGAPDQGRS